MKHVTVCMLAGALIGCLQFEPSPTHEYGVYVDPAFSPAQHAAIMDAVTEWQVASGNFMRFHGTKDPKQPFTISVMATHAGWEYKRDCGAAGSLGCTFWKNTDEPRTYLSLELSGDLFRETALHELGHAIGLEHLGPGNIMCADDGCASKHVECGDLEELAQAWDDEFDPQALPLCRESQPQ